MMHALPLYCVPCVTTTLTKRQSYTLGRGADEGFIKFNSGEYEVHRVERGGEVTHHVPGQLVVYPLLDLNHHKRDLHWYLRQVQYFAPHTALLSGNYI